MILILDRQLPRDSLYFFFLDIGSCPICKWVRYFSPMFLIIHDHLLTFIRVQNSICSFSVNLITLFMPFTGWLIFMIKTRGPNLLPCRIPPFIILHSFNFGRYKFVVYLVSVSQTIVSTKGAHQCS